MQKDAIMTIQLKITETRKSITDKFPTEIHFSLYNDHWVNSSVIGMELHESVSSDGLTKTHIKEVANWYSFDELKNNSFAFNNFNDIRKLFGQYGIKFEIINQSNEVNNLLLFKSGFDYVKNELKNYTGNYLEIGVFNGVSIKNISMAYPNRRVIGIDPFIESGKTVGITGSDFGQPINGQKENTLKNINSLTNITLYETTSQDFYNTISNSLIKELNVCAVLIDGDDSYENTLIDLEIARVLINSKSGFIIINDYYLESKTQAFQEFVQKQGNIITSANMIDNNTLAMVIKLN